MPAPKFLKVSHPVYGIHWHTKSSRSDLRHYLACCDTSRIKLATIGGEQEQGFEQAFSSLGFSYIKDKAPRLIDYIIGFQLIDRNEDNTKAAGVFGYKVGDQWLYTPVFFLSGDLKGHELLYVKNKDLFVPLKENWVNHIISRKPYVLGEGSARNTYEMGGVMPDISRLVYPPATSKFGSDNGNVFQPHIDDWCKPFLPVMGAIASLSPTLFGNLAKRAQEMDLRSSMAGSLTLLKAAWDAYCAYPLIKKGFDQFYGKDFFQQMGERLQNEHQSILKTASAEMCKSCNKPMHNGLCSYCVDKKANAASILEDPVPVKKVALEIFALDVSDDRAITVNKPDMLNDEEREKLLRDTVLVKDQRDPHAVSTVYNTQVKTQLTNPSETGMFEVLEKPGQFETMLVISHPHTGKGREGFSTVVRIGDTPRAWLNTHQTNLWAKQRVMEPDTPGKDKDQQCYFKDWWDKLSSATLEKGGTYLFINENGAGTAPFQVRESYGDGAYRVEWKDETQYHTDRPRFLSRTPEHTGRFNDGFDYNSYNAKLIHEDYESARLRSVLGDLHVPKNFKAMKLAEPPKPKKRDDSILNLSVEPGGQEGSKEKPIEPGSMLEVQLMLVEKTSSLKIIDDNGEVWVSTDKQPKTRMSKKAALLHLIRDHNLREETARFILKEAAHQRAVSYRIKYAEGDNFNLQPGPGAPAVPPPWTGTEQAGPNAYQSIYPQEETVPVDSTNTSLNDRNVNDPWYVPDRGAMITAQQAAASGQKELFDTGMFSGIIKAVRQDSLVERRLPNLMKSVDDLGRLLAAFFYHQEDFEDRYGKQNLPEMEDSFRNNFEGLGDLVLYLMEKRVGGLNTMPGAAGQTDTAEPDITESARN